MQDSKMMEMQYIEKLSKYLTCFNIKQIDSNKLKISSKFVNNIYSLVDCNRIPRDGLLLADKILDEDIQYRIVDFCSGSGVVLAGLYIRGAKQLFGIELDNVSESPLCCNLPKKNTLLIKKGDIFDRDFLKLSLMDADIITINPPQLPGNYEKDSINFGGKNGYEFAEKIIYSICEYTSFFKKNGKLYLIGFDHLYNYLKNSLKLYNLHLKEIFRENIPITCDSMIINKLPNMTYPTNYKNNSFYTVPITVMCIFS